MKKWMKWLCITFVAWNKTTHCNKQWSHTLWFTLNCMSKLRSAPTSRGRHLYICTIMVQFQSKRRFFHYVFALGVRFAMIRDLDLSSAGITDSISPTHSISIRVNDLHLDASPRQLFQDRDYVTLWSLQKYYFCTQAKLFWGQEGTITSKYFKLEWSLISRRQLNGPYNNYIN